MSLHLVANRIDPSRILDVGANVGAWATEAKRLWPNADIFMVEANKECEGELRKTGFPFQIALLSSKREWRSFFRNKNCPSCTGASMYQEQTQFYDGENASEEKLPTLTLDEMFPKASFDFIKIDVQGAELDVLKGGKSLVRRSKASLLELSLTEYNIGAPMAAEVAEYCRSIGFTKSIPIQNIIHPIEREKVIQIDTLFLR